MPEPILDMNAFENLNTLAGSDFIGELIHTFLEEAPTLLAQLRSSLSAGDADTFRRAAHSLKSNAASFGATQLTELAREMEGLARDLKLDDANAKMNAVEESYKQVAGALKGLEK